MEYIGFLFEILLLFVGVSVYRLATGKVKFHSTQQPQVKAFLKENGNLLRWMSLLLSAIMTVELALHTFQIFNKK